MWMNWIMNLYLIGLLMITALLLIPRPKCSYVIGEGKQSITKVSFDEDFCRRFRDANG
jgi:hypothetical protein